MANDFISRKDLEVTGNTYPHKERLKQLGCEWDAAARAWIAPTLEVKELCEQIVVGSEDSFQRPNFRCCGMPEDFDYDFLDKLDDPAQVPNLASAKAIAYTPSREDAERICGSGNVIRYWREEIRGWQ